MTEDWNWRAALSLPLPMRDPSLENLLKELLRLGVLLLLHPLHLCQQLVYICLRLRVDVSEFLDLFSGERGVTGAYEAHCLPIVQFGVGFDAGRLVESA